jgi:hypothetical protein
MGLNLSNQQIAQELDLNRDDLQYMTELSGVNYPVRVDDNYPGRF